ncbi:MAG TPA: murein biosynthesis integral membrane protein MurJ [Gemmatimonadetes bacterium]|nr:murein biosynthesis integral membrane protein MurJ [Gemmatimonadota bacterium]
MLTPPKVVGQGSSRGMGAATSVGAGIFLSRLVGFIRDRVFAHYFGISDLADAWRAALRLPNVIQNLLGEGTLSASLIPIYAEYLEAGEEEKAGRLAGAALGILVVVGGGLALLGILVAPVLVGVLFSRWSPDKQAITTTLVRILFPMTGVLVISAWALTILNSHRRFFISYVAPVLWNVSMIAAMVGSYVYLNLEERDLVVALGWGALAGGILQLALQVPFVFKYQSGLRISVGRHVEGVKEAIQNFIPVVAARGVVNLSGWLDLFLAALLVDGAVAVLGYAQTFYMLPISLFGMSIAASELPELSRMREEEHQVLASRVSTALRRVSFFLIPSAALYLVLGDVVVAAVFQTGAFGSVETLVTWSVLGAYAIGLPASASSRVLSSAFYALRDTRTPAKIAYIRIAVSVAIGLLLMIPLDRLGFTQLRLGAAGLALGASAGAWLEYVLLRRLLSVMIGAHGPGFTMILRVMLAATLAVGSGVLLQWILPVAHPIVLAVETLLPAGLVYLAAAALLGEDISVRARR